MSLDADLLVYLSYLDSFFLIGMDRALQDNPGLDFPRADQIREKTVGYGVTADFLTAYFCLSARVDHAGSIARSSSMETITQRIHVCYIW